MSTGQPLARYAAMRRVGDMVYLSGVIAVDPDSRTVLDRFDQLPDAVRAELGETREMSVDVFQAPVLVQSWFVLNRIRQLAEEAGGSMADVFKLVQYFTDLRDYPLYSRVRRLFYPGEPPVSTVVEVSGMLPSRAVRIEVEATAYIPLRAPNAMTTDRVLTVRVDRIVPQTPEISAFELVHPWGGELPGYRPGAHVNVHLPGGFARPYSLAQAPGGPARCRRYVIGVKREPQSRGGSASLHERVRAGDLLAVSTPRNTFPLQPQAAHHLLLAGGIGLTPLLCMAQHLQAEGASFTLAVFARSPRHLAFADAVRALGPAAQVSFDEPADAPKLDLAALVARPVPGTQAYLCGPAGFMAAARAAASHWPPDTVHLEYFAAPHGVAASTHDEPFTLRLTERRIDVPVAADQTAVEALHALGIDVPTSCEQGVCGTCVVGWAGGEAEHRDYCLTPGERLKKVALCCSRAKGGLLAVAL